MLLHPALTMHCKIEKLSSLNCKIPHFLTQWYQIQVQTHNLQRLFTLRLYAAPGRGALSYLIDTGYRKTLIRSKERGMWAADDLRDTIKQALILSNGVLWNYRKVLERKDFKSTSWRPVRLNKSCLLIIKCKFFGQN